MSNITAVILAGGIGKRFVPFITDKTLFPFMGKSLLERTLQMVANTGIKNVVIAVNQYNRDWIGEAQSLFPEINFTAVTQIEPKGMGDALLSLREVLPAKDIIVMNAGDMVDEKLLRELLDFIPNRSVVLTGRRTATYQPLGYFSLDENGKITGIVEKPGADNMPSDLANLVFHYFSNAGKLLDFVADAQTNASGDTDDVYERALDRLIKEGGVEVYTYDGPWQKLKFGSHVLDMVSYFLSPVLRNISDKAQVAPTATINGEVVVSSGAKILDGAIIQGPCWIGPNAIIGNNALVRQSIIEEGAVVGFGSEIVRSYVGAGSDLHHAYVGDSVLERKVHFGFNAHTANYRFDHESVAMKWTTGKTDSGRDKLGALIATGTEVGVNATIFPGICIGTESIIYPACVVYDAVPDRSIVKEKRGQVIEKAV